MHHMLESIRDRKILVYGDLMLDEFVYGTVTRISPEAPVPVLEFIKRESLLGGAANAAINVMAMGGNATLIGCVGDDAEGVHLLDLLKAKGINSDGLVIDSQRPTTKKTRVVAHSQHVIRIDHESTDLISASMEDAIIDQILSCANDPEVVIICDYAKGAVTDRVSQRIIEHCRSNSVQILLDTKSKNISRFTGVTSLTPNLQEAQALTQIVAQDNNLEEIGQSLIDLFKSESAFITRAEKGITAVTHDGGVHHIPAFATEVRDVTGAGDTVSAAIALSMAAGHEIQDSALLSNAAAAAVVRKVGTAVPTISEIEGFLNEYV